MTDDISTRRDRLWTGLGRIVFRVPVLLPVLVSVALSTFLIHRKFGLLGVTFLGRAPLTPMELPLFLFIVTVIDLTFIYTLYTLWLAVCRVLHIGYRAYAVAAIAAATTLVIVANVLVYDLVTYMGDLSNIRATLAMSDGFRGTLPYIYDALPRLLLTLVVGGAVVASGVAVLWRASRVIPANRPLRLRRALATVAMLWIAVIGLRWIASMVGMNAITLSTGRTWTSTLVAHAVSSLTDFDRDGYGWIGIPRDFAPFDAKCHPFALDIPANGIDENGLGGDLPTILDIEPRMDMPASPASRPDVLFVFVCTLRVDAVFGGDLGPSATPFLRSLAQRGLGIDQAYAHRGFTTSALQTSLSGQIGPASYSLVRDMKSMGYATGWFSAENEDFGDTRSRCTLEEADAFFDATYDPQSRVTAFTTPSSMMLPGARVIREIERFVPTVPADRPMFVGVMLPTPHYPYSQDSPKMLIPHTVVPPNAITERNRPAVVAMYRNAVANLDDQVQSIVEILQRSRPSRHPVIIVLGDHGESFFDDGTLGHGLKLNDVQTRVPVVIANAWGTVPIPFGLSEIRPLLLRMAATPKPAERKLTTQPAAGPLFQWVGEIASPLQIGFVTDQGRTVMDLTQMTVTDTEGHVRPIHADTLTDHDRTLIQTFESLQWLEHNRPNRPYKPRIATTTQPTR